MKLLLLFFLYPFLLISQTQIGLDIDGEAAEDKSGWSVSLSSNGSIVAIGAIFNIGNGNRSGHVRIYENQNSEWVQIGSDIDGEAVYDNSGFSISLSSDGSIVAIGAFGNDENGSGSGHVRVYENQSGVWIQIGLDIDGEAEYDYSGISVSLSSDGNIVAIGASGNDENGDGSGHVRIYDLSALLGSNEFVLSNFSIYPNPTSKQFTIQLQGALELEKVRIYNQLGQFIKKESQLIIDVSTLSSGIYYIEIITNKGKATKKLIID